MSTPWPGCRRLASTKPGRWWSEQVGVRGPRHAEQDDTALPEHLRRRRRLGPLGTEGEHLGVGHPVTDCDRHCCLLRGQGQAKAQVVIPAGDTKLPASGQLPASGRLPHPNGHEVVTSGGGKSGTQWGMRSFGGFAMTHSFDRRSPLLAGGLALGAGAAWAGALGMKPALCRANEAPGGTGSPRPGRSREIPSPSASTPRRRLQSLDRPLGRGRVPLRPHRLRPPGHRERRRWVSHTSRESITSNADSTAFTITLRPNIVFHDGTPLDAAALHPNIEATASAS